MTSQREPPQFWDIPPEGFKKFKKTNKPKKKKVSLEERQARTRYKIARKKVVRKAAARKLIPVKVSEIATELGGRGGRKTLLKKGKKHYSEIGKMHGEKWKREHEDLL